MTFVPAPGVYEIHQRALLWSQAIENVHHVLPASATDPAAVAFAAHEAWKTHMLPVLAGNYELRETYVVELTDQTSPTATATTSPFPTGTDSGGAAPGNVALAVSFRTDGRGRSSRGRNYISGFSDDWITGNNILANEQANLLDAINAYFTEMVTGPLGMQHVVLSRFQNNAPRSQALAQPVTSRILVDGRIDSQRRRLTGRGQ